MIRFDSIEQARAFGEKHCPPGWRVRAWENLGFHVSWESPGISISPGSDATRSRPTFYALISGSPISSGYGGAAWSPGGGSHDTMAKTAAHAYRAFREYVEELNRANDVVGRAVGDLQEHRRQWVKL